MLFLAVASRVAVPCDVSLSNTPPVRGFVVGADSGFVGVPSVVSGFLAEAVLVFGVVVFGVVAFGIVLLADEVAGDLVVVVVFLMVVVVVSFAPAPDTRLVVVRLVLVDVLESELPTDDSDDVDDVLLGVPLPGVRGTPNDVLEVDVRDVDDDDFGVVVFEVVLVLGVTGLPGDVPYNLLKTSLDFSLLMDGVPSPDFSRRILGGLSSDSREPLVSFFTRGLYEDLP